jgi:nitrogen-specific signal transduction histidine kinase
LSKSNSKILIEIKDYAGGIKGRENDSIFKDIITTKKNGSGLGLFVSYKIISSYFKGKLWFETEKDKGTSFFILI